MASTEFLQIFWIHAVFWFPWQHVMQKEIEKMKQELISLKEEQSFETDADDDLFFDESVLPKT